MRPSLTTWYYTVDEDDHPIRVPRSLAERLVFRHPGPELARTELPPGTQLQEGRILLLGIVMLLFAKQPRVVVQVGGAVIRVTGQPKEREGWAAAAPRLHPQAAIWHRLAAALLKRCKRLEEANVRRLSEFLASSQNHLPALRCRVGGDRTPASWYLYNLDGVLDGEWPRWDLDLDTVLPEGVSIRPVHA